MVSEQCGPAYHPGTHSLLSALLQEGSWPLVSDLFHLCLTFGDFQVFLFAKYRVLFYTGPPLYS